MRKLFITTITALTLGTTFGSSATAMAADPVYNDEGAIVDTSGPTKKLTFEDGEFLDGEVLRLDETILYNNRGRHHESLITIKMSFVPELIELSWDAPFI